MSIKFQKKMFKPTKYLIGPVFHLHLFWSVHKIQPKKEVILYPNKCKHIVNLIIYPGPDP